MALPFCHNVTSMAARSWTRPSQLSSAQLKMVSMHLEKSIIFYAFSPISQEVSPVSIFETVLLFIWLMVGPFPSYQGRLLSTPVPCLSPPGGWWGAVLGFVPAGSLSSFSTLQIFQNASHLWWLLFPTAYLLSHFPWLWCIQGSSST